MALVPGRRRRLVSGNGPAILAELAGEWWLQADAAALSTIEQPALLVMAADSPPEFHEAPQALAHALPNARVSLVGGGHLIDPAAPEVLAFIEEVLSIHGLPTARARRQALHGRLTTTQ